MYFGFYCIILHFTQRIEFVVFIKSVCFGTLIYVENSHFNEYSVMKDLSVRETIQYERLKTIRKT